SASTLRSPLESFRMRTPPASARKTIVAPLRSMGEPPSRKRKGIDSLLPRCTMMSCVSMVMPCCAMSHAHLAVFEVGAGAYRRRRAVARILRPLELEIAGIDAVMDDRLEFDEAAIGARAGDRDVA